METDEDVYNIHEEEEGHVNDVVKIILMLDHSKKPFKQSEILGYLLNKPSRKNWTSIFHKASEKLKELGLVLRECKNTHIKSYFLTSNQYPTKTLYQYASKDEVADRTLLIIVLTFIFMREKLVTDVDILNHLHKIKIYSPEKSVHKYFGDIKKKIFTDFISQMYLEKIVIKEMNSIEIRWGERANAEISKRSILEFAIAVGYQNKIQPKNLISHYVKVMDEENQNQ